MEEENLSLSAEELARIDSYQNELDTYEAEVMASVEAPEAATAASEPAQPTQTSQPTQQQEQPTTEPSERAQAVETSPFRNPDGTIDYEKITRYGAEQDTAEAVGLYDFAVDSINKLSNWITGEYMYCHIYLNLKTRMHSLCVKHQPVLFSWSSYWWSYKSWWYCTCW